MTAAKQNLVIEQGATYKKRLFWRDKNKRPINLTGYTAIFVLKDKIGGTPLHTATTENGGIVIDPLRGSVSIVIDADATANMSFDSAVYTLKLIAQTVAGTPDKTRLLEGKVTLSKE